MSKWRESMTPGVIYRKGGDLILCLFLSGDNHYTWVRVRVDAKNKYGQIFFDVLEIGYCYGGLKPEYPGVRPFSAEELVKVLANKSAMIQLPKEAQDGID